MCAPAVAAAHARWPTLLAKIWYAYRPSDLLDFVGVKGVVGVWFASFRVVVRCFLERCIRPLLLYSGSQRTSFENSTLSMAPHHLAKHPPYPPPHPPSPPPLPFSPALPPFPSPPNLRTRPGTLPLSSQRCACRDTHPTPQTHSRSLLHSYLTLVPDPTPLCRHPASTCPCSQ